jgi:hypothetical protein
VNALDELVGPWYPLPDAAELLGTDVGRLRRLLSDGALVAVRLGERQLLGIPAAFLIEDEATSQWSVLASLGGTLTVLRDAGFSDAEAVAWLFTPDASLSGLCEENPTPIGVLRAGHKTEIRRRAQALAL